MTIEKLIVICLLAVNHKTMHKKFQFGIPVIILLQIALIIWIYSR